ncbi:MAG: hypothetical protein KTV45_13065 [Acidimicrobiia bacterium]|nr:hypothetical protein [Acidimicrobiia bacterium]
MDKIPFSAYDFFGCLSSGVTTLAGVSFAYQGVEAFRLEMNASQALVLVIAAYLVGHIVASVSSFLLERRLTRKLIGSPTWWLFHGDPLPWWRRFLKAYHKPLPEVTAKRVLDRAKGEADINEPGEALFYHCFGVVRRDEYPRARLAVFLNLYGFARNTSMAALISTALIGLAIVVNDQIDPTELWAGLLSAAFVGVAMYLRYLKFYRQYSIELYVTYAEVKS